MPVDVFVQGPLTVKATVDEQQRRMSLEWRCTKESFLKLLGYQIESYGGKHTAMIGFIRAMGRENYSFDVDIMDLLHEAKQGTAMKSFGIKGKGLALADHDAVTRHAWAKIDVRVIGK